ncbi:MAG: membrane protein [Pirellulaceae bacterium]|nr:MAG: membrane protein [Pirellulaceae bacterium]
MSFLGLAVGGLLWGGIIPGLSHFVTAGTLLAVVIVFLLYGASRIPTSYNVLNLQVRWRTTLLTALAFTLVTALLTVMLAFVNGMYALTLGSGNPENVIILSEGSTDEGFSNLGFSDVNDIGTQPGILQEDGVPLLSRETYLVVNQPIPNAPPGRPKRRFLQLRGIDDPKIAARVHRVELYPGGEWFSDAGVRQLSDGQIAVEVVLGEGIARELARDRDGNGAKKIRLEVGDQFILNDRPWLVVGVMQSSGKTFDSEVWGKRSLIGPMFGKETYSTLVARTASPDDAVKLRDYFNRQYKRAAVNAQIETDYFASLSETNKQFLVAIAFVTVVLAIGGVFGIMNTMYAAISQRTKDIGVLRLLGFRRHQILVAFLTESLMIAVAGGVVGIALGCLSHGWTANSVVGGQGGGKFVVLRLMIDADTIALGLLLTVATGILGGLMPALRAMRMSALDALR